PGWTAAIGLRTASIRLPICWRSNRPLGAECRRRTDTIRRMLKIDTHAHILPAEWPNLAEKYGDDRFPVMVRTESRHRIYKDGKFFREVWANAFDAQFRIADYAKFGVQTQVISTVPVLFSYWAKP